MTAPTKETPEPAPESRERETFYIGIIRRKDRSMTVPPIELCRRINLPGLSQYTPVRTLAADFLSKSAVTVAELTHPDERHIVSKEDTVTDGDKLCYTAGTSAGVVGVMITTAGYDPVRARNAIYEIVNEFVDTHSRESYKGLAKGSTDWSGTWREPLPWPKLDDHMKLYKFSKVSPMTDAQRTLEETKELLRQTIDSLIQRGEKLDNMVAKSDALSAASRDFYRQSKKQNSCCVIM